MDLTLTEILDTCDSFNEDQLSAAYAEVVSVAARLRKLQSARYVAIDTYLTFDKGEYAIKIGDLTLRGHHVHYTDYYDKRARLCRWGDHCRDPEKCGYNHSGRFDVVEFGESPLMKRFLNCQPDQLAQFYLLNPALKGEIESMKASVLDKIIRLIWLSS